MIIRKVLLVFSFTICLFAFGQTNRENMVHLATLPRLEVINEQIYQLLDSLILYNKDCIYTILGKPHLFRITSPIRGNDTLIGVDSFQYLSTDLWNKDGWTGYFYYKNNLVVIASFDIFSLFFRNTSDIQEFYYKRYDWRTDFAEFDNIDLVYYYTRNTFIPKSKSLCADTHPYMHIAQKKETWKSIANLYGITIEELKLLNKTKKNKLPKLRARMKVKITPENR